MKLEEIGFYTLCDKRAEEISSVSNMKRGEIIITDKCNFNCPYCRGPHPECKGEKSLEEVKEIIDLWTNEGLENIRFSGGEPTMHKDLDAMIEYAKSKNVEHVAISTNGSADYEVYEDLVKSGVNDFSISLDACCSSFADQMAGTDAKFDTIISNIKRLSTITYVTVGMVFTDHNVKDIYNTIKFAHDLGVSDIRIISAAQCNSLYVKFTEALGLLDKDILDAHPILKYRVNNILNKRNVRGFTKNDTNKCYLLHDDSMVTGSKHFPCVIYMREGGKAIGKIGKDMRKDRIEFFKNFDTHRDPICKKNCLDVCIDFNNKCKELSKIEEN